MQSGEKERISDLLTELEALLREFRDGFLKEWLSEKETSDTASALTLSDADWRSYLGAFTAFATRLDRVVTKTSIERREKAQVRFILQAVSRLLFCTYWNPGESETGVA